MKEGVHMRMLDTDRDAAVDNLTLYLKKDEAIELLEVMKTLIKQDNFDLRIHLNDDGCERDFTVMLYDESYIDMMDKRTRRLVLEEV